MKKILRTVHDPKLPPNVAVFQDHLALGLDCFDLNWFDFRPHTCSNKKYGNGLLFSQLDKSHKGSSAAENSLIVSNEGLHLPNDKLLSFTNEQTPTKIAMLVLSAMVLEQPLQFDCPLCD